jgi:hypothetical protein
VVVAQRTVPIGAWVVLLAAMLNILISGTGQRRRARHATPFISASSRGHAARATEAISMRRSALVLVIWVRESSPPEPPVSAVPPCRQPGPADGR